MELAHFASFLVRCISSCIHIHVAQNGFPKPILEARDINKA